MLSLYCYTRLFTLKVVVFYVFNFIKQLCFIQNLTYREIIFLQHDFLLKSSTP